MQLSERLGYEPPTLSNMIKKLEEYGLVHHRQDEADAWITRVSLLFKENILVHQKGSRGCRPKPRSFYSKSIIPTKSSQ